MIVTVIMCCDDILLSVVNVRNMKSLIEENAPDGKKVHILVG